MEASGYPYRVRRRLIQVTYWHALRTTGRSDRVIQPQRPPVRAFLPGRSSHPPVRPSHSDGRVPSGKVREYLVRALLRPPCGGLKSWPCVLQNSFSIPFLLPSFLHPESTRQRATRDFGGGGFLTPRPQTTTIGVIGGCLTGDGETIPVGSAWWQVRLDHLLNAHDYVLAIVILLPGCVLCHSLHQRRQSLPVARNRASNPGPFLLVSRCMSKG